MEGEAKENDLRPISDRISGTIRRFLLEDLRDRGQARIKRGAQGALAPGPPSSKGPPASEKKKQ